jgi:chorismate dehydratase
MPPDAERMLARHDAALLIADSALLAATDRCTVHDLAADWHDMTGLPFVFAVWALRAEAAAGLSARQLGRFRESLHHGLERLEEIARRHGTRLGMSPEDALAYLRENIRYGLGEEERAGLELFLRLAAEEGLIPAEVPLRFAGASPPALSVGGRSTSAYGDDPSHP